MIGRQVQEFEVVAAIDGEIRGIVARNGPQLLSKLPPPEETLRATRDEADHVACLERSAARHKASQATAPATP